MNYEEKYKQALERAKKEWIENLDNCYTNYRERLEIIFPELIEDKDEKIRKVLLNDFKNNCSEYYCEGVNRDMIIAWLEKQGEQSNGIIGPRKVDADKVIAWLVANICDFEYYVKRFKEDFGI